MNKIINNWFALYNLMNDFIEQFNNKTSKIISVQLIILKPQNTSIPLWLTDFFEEKCIFYIDENIEHMLT